MNTNIPASPIPQPTPKIGTRYIAVERYTYAHRDLFFTSHAFVDGANLETEYPKCDIYTLLDPADAAELERLRKVEDEAAQAFIDDTNLGTRAELGAAFFAWTKARAARFAFEAKIGGGV